MKIDSDVKIGYNSEDEMYLITTTNVETINQKEMFQRIQQKTGLLTNAKNKEKRLLEQKTNMRQVIERTKNELKKNYENEMPQTKETIAELEKEIKELKAISKDDSVMNEKFVLYTKLSKEFKERQVEIKKQLQEEQKKFISEMNK